MDFKKNVDDFFSVDDEIKEASKSLKVLRDKRKELSDGIVEYLKANKKERISTSRGVLLLNNALKIAKNKE